MRGLVLLMLAALGCAPGRDVSLEAIEVAAADVVLRRPFGEEGAALFFAPEWQLPSGQTEPLPAEVRAVIERASALPVAAKWPPPADSSRTLYLYLWPLQQPRGDSVQVTFGWLSPTGGDGGGGWGEEYLYRFDCSRACRSDPPLRSTWN